MGTTSSPTASTAEAGPAAPPQAPQPVAGWPTRLWRSPAFPGVLQAAALGVLVLMIVVGWGRTGLPGGGVAVPLLYTNLAALGFWTLWLMGLILLLPGVGRLWCTVCPVGWCNDLAARAGAKADYPRRLQHLGFMALLLFGFNAAAELWGLNRSPDATAKLLALALGAAVLAGLAWRGRVFCRFWCPVGGMVALTSRLAPVEVAVVDNAVCRRCETKACFFGATRWYRLSWSAWHTVFPHKRPGCPAYLFPPEAAPGPHCLMCTGCIKNCPHDDVRWGWRPVASGLWPAAARDRSEALIVIVMTGLVFHRLARFWGGLRGVVEAPTELVATLLPTLPPLLLKGVNLLCGFVLWPLAFYLVLAAIARAAAQISVAPWPAPGEEPAGLLYDVAEIDREQRGRETGWAARRQTLWGYLAVYGYAFVPLVAGAYAAFALVKLNEKAGYLPLALADPAGMKTSIAINQLRILPGPESLVALAVVRWGALGLAAAGLVVGLWSAGRIGARAYGEGTPAARRGAAVFRVGLLALGILLLLCLRAWLFSGPRG
jgi:ferredoxin